VARRAYTRRGVRVGGKEGSWNQADKFHLALVLVAEDDSIEGPFYLQNPFDAEPGWGVSSINFDLKALLDRARSRP
jgi:hypothetical protein